MAYPELVMFDFDGTLVDTAPDIVRATNLFLRSKKLPKLPEARIRAEIGMGLKQLLFDVYPDHNLDAEAQGRLHDEFTAIYENEYLKSPTLFPGAREFLNEFEGHIAIVSNKRERFIHSLMRHLGLDQLKWCAVIGGDSGPTMKPHAGPFLDAMAAAGAGPESSVLVGDGIPDVVGAVQMNFPCVAVDFGYTAVEQLVELGAWARIASFAELGPLLARL